MKSNSLELQDLVVAREGVALTKPLAVTLGGGEMLVVRGNNGSGKSTFLKTVAGLLKPGSGAVLREGRVQYFGHRNGLARDMAVRDNVLLWARLGGYGGLAAAAMHYFDLGDVADVTLSKLSAGWQQRVALTRLITMPADLWLLDEPTANLDAAGTALLQTLIQARREQGGIVVIATHSPIQGESIKTITIN